VRRLGSALSLRDSPIGRGASLPVGAAMATLGLAAAAFDMGWMPWSAGWTTPWRTLPALGAVALFALLLRGDRDAIGARLSPLPSVRYWVCAVLVLAAIFAAIVAAGLGVYVALGLDTTPPPPTPAEDLWQPLVEAPLVEETIYRWALATGVAALGSRWLAVLVSGAAFGYLHVVYSVPAPNNLAAGFIFAWMYLRSGSIAVPIAFHALGNLTVAVLNYLAYVVL
jgi:membrane protease YdiL (CAAX protease family)